jgi:hypothetical protein
LVLGGRLSGFMGTPQMRGCHIEAYRLAGIPLGFSAGLPIRQHNSFCWGPRRGIGNPSGLYKRYGTRLRAHALNPTMHRTDAAKIATFNTASIMLPSTESRLPFEVLIFRRPARSLRWIGCGAGQRPPLADTGPGEKSIRGNAISKFVEVPLLG